MKTIMMMAFAMLATGVFGQSIIDKHYQHLTNKEKTTQVYVSAKMFSFAKFVPEDGDEDVAKAKDFLSNIESFNLLFDEENEDPIAEYRRSQDDLSAYDELVRIKSKEVRLSLFIEEADGIVDELVGIAALDTSFLVFSLNGKMDLNQVGDIVEMIEEDAIEDIIDLREARIDEVKVYPNPVSVGNRINVEIPSGFTKSTVTLYDANGSKVMSKKVEGTYTEISSDNLNTGYHMVEITDGTITHKRKVLIVK